jgi:hypothetical protein
MIATVLFAMALAAPPNAAPPPKAPTQKAHAKKADTNADKSGAPDAELIGFLGDYEDAADGLDPIGLSEQMTDDDKPAADEKKKGGHEP